MKKVFKILGILVLLLIVAVVGVGFYIHQFLPNTGPAPELKIEITPERVEHGRYLANHVMVCMDCHSTRNWGEFSGPPIEGTLGKGGDRFDHNLSLPGIFYARNITPAGLGNWTDGEIFRAITTGVTRDGRALFPLMPHPAYGTLDKEDIYDVIAYLRSIPAIENEVPPAQPDFPFSLILKTIPQKANFTQRPDTSNKLAYGKYLVTAATCIDCHTPFEKGKLVFEKAFSGGRQFPLPSGTLTSPNITPHETGIGNMTEEAFIERFRQYSDSTGKHLPVAPDEYNTIMPWTMYAGMTDQDLSTIYTYLRSLPPVENKVTKFVRRTP